MASPQKFRKIIDKISFVANEYGIRNTFVVGGYPRAIIMGSVKDDVNDLDFASAWPGEAVKLGTFSSAELLGEFAEIYHRTGTVKFTYEEVDLEFQGVLGSLSDFQPIMG